MTVARRLAIATQGYRGGDAAGGGVTQVIIGEQAVADDEDEGVVLDDHTEETVLDDTHEEVVIDE